MTHSLKSVFILFGAVALLIVASLISSILNERKAEASALGLPAAVTNATSSNPTVGTTAVTLVATSSGCSARIITTVASPIMLTFSDNQAKTPTGTYGHLQAASTTVAYDSAVYGCGLVKAYAFVSSAISVTETY